MGEKAKVIINKHSALEILKRPDLDLNKFYNSDLKIFINSSAEEIKRLNNIINEVYEYLNKKKDVPEWWDTDFMICMNILKGGTGNLKDILGSDKYE